MEHRGTTALITGASSGLGEQLARLFAIRGANLVLVSRHAEELKALADSIAAETGVQVAIYGEDLARPHAGARLAARIADDGLIVDTLINNAGMGIHGPFVTGTPQAQFAEVQLNAAIVVDLTRALLPQMLAGGRGALVNIASTSAYQPTPDMAVYGATKAFVLSFTEAVAFETRGSGVKVVAISPGPMRTPFFDKMGTTRPGVGQWQTPDQVAEFILDTLDRRCTPPSVISGVLNAVPIFAARFAPRSVVLALTGRAVGA